MSETLLKLRTDRLEWRVVADEIVALTADTDRYLGANKTGALLWHALVQGATMSDLRAILEAEGAAPASAGPDVDVFLAALRARDLLEE